jgi:UDP-2,3-diacylglucosamine hydrolase
MNSSKKTLFISDLHLQEKQPLISERLAFFLNDNKNVDAIYILGDLFEAWIGDDDKSPLHTHIIQLLKSLTDAHVPIYFLPGNRDFLIGNAFLTASGCRLLNEEEKIILYGTPILLMHGDTLCTNDTAYLKARKWMHQSWLQKLFLLLPLRIRKNLAEKMRAQSLKYTQSTALDKMDVVEAAVQAVMQKHQVQILIHGHTHQPAMHHFTLNQQPALRIVLGAWHDKAKVLVWHASGKKEFLEY